MTKNLNECRSLARLKTAELADKMRRARKQAVSLEEAEDYLARYAKEQLSRAPSSSTHIILKKQEVWQLWQDAVPTTQINNNDPAFLEREFPALGGAQTCVRAATWVRGVSECITTDTGTNTERAVESGSETDLSDCDDQDWIVVEGDVGTEDEQEYVLVIPALSRFDTVVGGYSRDRRKCLRHSPTPISLDITAAESRVNEAQHTQHTQHTQQREQLELASGAPMSNPPCASGAPMSFEFRCQPSKLAHRRHHAHRVSAVGKAKIGNTRNAVVITTHQRGGCGVIHLDGMKCRNDRKGKESKSKRPVLTEFQRMQRQEEKEARQLQQSRKGAAKKHRLAEGKRHRAQYTLKELKELQDKNKKVTFGGKKAKRLAKAERQRTR